MKNNTPHRYGRSAIHFWLLAPIVAMIVIIYLSSCNNPKRGCYSTRGMSGYSYIKNLETGRVAVLDKNGNICIYHEKPMSRKEAQQYLKDKY